MGRFTLLFTIKINQNPENKLYNCRRWHHQLNAKDAHMKLMAYGEVGSLRLVNIKTNLQGKNIKRINWQ